jgi:hypothetical protein
MNALNPSRSIRTGNSWQVAINALPDTRLVSVFFLLALGAFVAARLWHLTATPLSFDEIFSVHAVRHDWSGLIEFVRRDLVHPPLFYVMLKLWVGLGGESLLWLRLFSTLIAIVSLFPLLQLCQELDLRAIERNSALALVAVNGFLIYHSHELRMYGLFLLLSLFSLWLFVRLIKVPAISWTLLCVLFGINLLLVYTHYFGWILIGAELLALIRWRRQKLMPFLGSVIAIASCLTPWLYLEVRVYANRGLSHNLGWIERPHLSNLSAFYMMLDGEPFDFLWGGTVGLLLFGVPIVLWGWRVFRSARGEDKREDNTSWLLFLFAFLPVAIVYLASLLFAQAVWLPRGLIFVAVPYLILVAIAVNHLRPRWASLVMLFVVLGWAMLAGLQSLSRVEESIRMDSWVHQMIQAESRPANDIKVYSLDENSPYVIWFYLSSENESRFQVILVKGLRPRSQRTSYWLNDEMFPSVVVKELTALEGDHFWVAFADKQWKQARTPQEIFKDAGYRVGVGFEGGVKEGRTYLFPVWRRT